MAMFGTLSAFDPIDRKYIAPQQPFTPAATPNPYAMKPAGGFFAPGGTGRAIAGSIGDALLQLGHMQPIYQPAEQAQREFAMRRQLAEQERQNTLSNEKTLYDYKLQNPDDELTRTMVEAGIDPHGPQGVALYQQHAQNIANPPQYRQGPDGNFYRIDVGGTPPPTRPVGKLTPIPEGGPAANPPATFPHLSRYYGGQ